jgi:hypothetical protein
MLLIWTTTGLIVGELLWRFVKPDLRAPAEASRELIRASR